MSSRRATTNVNAKECNCDRAAENVADVDGWSCVASTYPSSLFLEKLSSAVDRAVNPRRGDEVLNTAHQWPDDLSRRIALLQPVLEEWYGKRQYWYAADILEAVAGVTDAKCEAVEALSSTVDGTRVLRSSDLAAAEERHAERINTLLNMDFD